MIEWEYRKIALNDVPRKSSEVDVLDRAGEEGWELVTVLSNNIAYLKRPLDDPKMHETRELPSHAHNKDSGAPSTAPKTQDIKPKYRDPKTGETWSGRGRMATWLKHKQDAGENVDAYLV